MYPFQDRNDVIPMKIYISNGVTKRRVCYTGDTKESKKYGCVCTCCHIDNFPWYKCVIFLTKNYNFDIPAVANALSKRQREIRQKEFI